MMHKASSRVSLFMDSSLGGIRIIVICKPTIDQPASASEVRHGADTADHARRQQHQRRAMS
jgi:hypothetical protein